MLVLNFENVRMTMDDAGSGIDSSLPLDALEQKLWISAIVRRTAFLEQTPGKGNLDTKEDRHSVDEFFTNETGETFGSERIKTCYLNQKSNLQPKLV